MLTRPTFDETCDLCGSTSFHPIAVGTRYGRAAPIVQCLGCGLTFQHPKPTIAALEAFYRDEYRALYSGSTTPAPALVEDQRRRGEEILRRIRSIGEIPDRVLDVGCGAGAALLPFRDAGSTVVGLEPGPFGVWGRDHLGLDIRAASEVAAAADTGPFGLVMLSYVLEHVASPHETLAEIAVLMGPGGRIYVEVPDLLSARGAIEDYFHIAHLTYFTPATLTATLEAAGFDVADTQLRPDYSVWQVATWAGRQPVRRLPGAPIDDPAATAARLQRQMRKERVDRTLRGVLKPPAWLALQAIRRVKGEDAAARFQHAARQAWVSTRTRF